MRLTDLRKLTVKKHLRVRFTLSNGMECTVNEHGVARIPALSTIPGFNLEDELTAVMTFLVEPAAAGPKDKAAPKVRAMTRDEMSALAAAGSHGETAHDEHDD